MVPENSGVQVGRVGRVGRRGRGDPSSRTKLVRGLLCTGPGPCPPGAGGL